eukprot:54191_1
MDDLPLTVSDHSVDCLDDETTTGVSIAYTQEIEDECYYFRSFLPSKVGGKPAWLNPRNIPTFNDLKCQQCKKPLKFLLQLYAPLYQFERSHHRILYIFICRAHECCGKPGTLKALRSQLSSQNIFYENFDSKNDYNEQDIDQKEALLIGKLSKYKHLGIEPYANIPNCIVCGLHGTFQCGGCKNPLVHYCSKEHQKYHWHKQHRKYCKELKQLETETQLHNCLKDYAFATLEIIPDVEPLPITMDLEKLKIDENKRISTLIKEYKKKGDDSGYDENDLKLLEEQMAKDFDNVYLKFQERIHRAPQQIIRYADGENVDQDRKNNDEEEDTCGWSEPLWMGSQGMIDCNKDVPKCTECGGERKFEFQVMPQLLHVLKQGIKDLDWGILAVFSCVNSCGDGNDKYFEEFIHYQPSYGAFEHRDDNGLIG